MFISVFDLSVICTPIGKTAEAEYYRRVAKAKEKMGGRLSPGARKITGTRELPYLEVGKYQRLKLCKFEIQIKFSGFPLRQTVVTNVSRFLTEIKIRLFKASVQFLCTADGFTSS